MSAKSANARLAENLSDGGDGIDFSERAGFMSGKSAAIAEWSFRKSEREFGVLVNRLRVRKWQKENPAKRRATALRWWRANREKANARHCELARKAPRSRKCDMCPVVYELPYPHPRGGVRTCCSDECRRRKDNEQARRHQAPKRRAKGISETRCGNCREPGHNRRTCSKLAPTERGQAALST